MTAGRIKELLNERFSLRTGKEAGQHTIQEAIDGSSIRGSNLWILLLAIIICSIGLNTNSSAIVIGAMLISPLMGPIIGIGVGLAIYDTDLIKKGLRNLLFAFVLSLVVSSLYFSISPLTVSTKEIMARVSPTIWDVVIAFSGGLVGAIALTRKEKSLTFVPGVAISTALMPPLCVTGYRLTQGNFLFAAKAFYLLSINSVFIATATFVIAKLLHLPKTIYPTPERKKTVQRIVWTIIILTAIPSAIMTTQILQQTLIDQKINTILEDISQNYTTQVIEKRINYNAKSLSLWLVGSYLSEAQLKTISDSITDASLLSEYTITIKQGIESDPQATETMLEPLLSTAIAGQEETTIALIKKSLTQFKDTLPPTTRQLLAELAQINTEIIAIDQGSEIQPLTSASGDFLTGSLVVDMYTITTTKVITLKEKSKIKNRLQVRLDDNDVIIKRTY